jgi:hypothetical protein
LRRLTDFRQALVVVVSAQPKTAMDLGEFEGSRKLAETFFTCLDLLIFVTNPKA